MALLFSAVKVTAGDDETELLVGGIPREYDDLEGWKSFDDFMNLPYRHLLHRFHRKTHAAGAVETRKF